jgi:hypothetical protein
LKEAFYLPIKKSEEYWVAWVRQQADLRFDSRTRYNHRPLLLKEAFYLPIKKSEEYWVAWVRQQADLRFDSRTCYNQRPLHLKEAFSLLPTSPAQCRHLIYTRV